MVKGFLKVELDLEYKKKILLSPVAPVNITNHCLVTFSPPLNWIITNILTAQTRPQESSSTSSLIPYNILHHPLNTLTLEPSFQPQILHKLKKKHHKNDSIF